MLFAAQPEWLGRVLGVFIRALSTALLKRAGLRQRSHLPQPVMDSP